jgi:1-pyrroline-5-carboxylate dehydrogenase
MASGFFKTPHPINEPVKDYAKNSQERKEVLLQYKKMFEQYMQVPLYIGNSEITTKDQNKMFPPHQHTHCVGSYSIANKNQVDQAIDAALKARESWATMDWEHRAAIFLKAADLIAGPYRSKINAATMIAQSKTIHQAEIDAACEFIDFLRFNVHFMHEIYNEQPISSEGIWNRLEYRPLEGFVYVVSPFNFTAIAGNLCASAALMGNVIVWKPSDHQVYSAQVIMEIFKEAGLPNGVINMIMGDPEMITDTILDHADFAGIHFTGSTHVFKNLWNKIGTHVHRYKNYPRIVGETGGKDFIIAHPSANCDVVSTAIVRGAFEFQGQKCSAASRVYLPKSIAETVIKKVQKDIGSFKIGSPENFENFITAVIHEASFDKLAGVIDCVKNDKTVEIIAGGTYDKSEGYFINPTVILTKDPHYFTMETELFGPIVTIYVYDDNAWEDTLRLIDTTSEYALTGAVISTDRKAIDSATTLLENAAGNFYINDKPTGAVVGQQPFGGARASGTNDKAGSKLNLLRWVSPRLIKETLNPPTDYRYPFLDG